MLKELYDEIYIPVGVLRELEAGKEKSFYTELSQMKWINVKEIKNKKIRFFIRRNYRFFYDEFLC